MRKDTLIATIIVYAAILSSCARSGHSVDPASQTPSIIEGTAFHVQNGSVAIFSFDLVALNTNGGLPGSAVPIATAFLDTSQHFTATIPGGAQSVMVVVADGTFIEVDGTPTTLSSGNPFIAVVNVVAGQTVAANVTPWTTMAAGLAQYKYKLGSPVASAIDQANAAISGVLGVDVMVPLVVGGMGGSTALTPDVEYGYSILGMSRLSTGLVNLPRTDLFALRAFNDIRFDGVLDGHSESGQLTYINRHDLAVAILGVAQARQKEYGYTPAQLLPIAKRINDSTSAIFGNVAPIPLDANGPLISNVTPADNATLYGTVQVKASVLDLIGLSSVELWIDTVVVGTASDLFSPAFTLDTKKLSEGVHTLSVRAQNIAGTTANVDQIITVANKQLSITNIFPVENSYVGRNVTVSASVSDPAGLKSVEFIVGAKSQGLASNLSAPSVTMDTTRITEGPHTLSVVAINNAGYTLTVGVPLIFDNTVPVLVATAPAKNSYQKGTFTVSATATDTNLLDVAFGLEGSNTPVVAADKFNATLQIDTTQYKDGAHSIAVMARDRAYNIVIQTLPFTFDNTPPVIANVYPPPGTVVGNEQFNVGATISDLSLVDIEFDLDGLYYSGSGTLSVPQTFIVGSRLSKGSHTIIIKATDATGHVSTASTSVVH